LVSAHQEKKNKKKKKASSPGLPFHGSSMVEKLSNSKDLGVGSWREGAKRRCPIFAARKPVTLPQIILQVSSSFQLEQLVSRYPLACPLPCHQNCVGAAGVPWESLDVMNDTKFLYGANRHLCPICAQPTMDSARRMQCRGFIWHSDCVQEVERERALRGAQFDLCLKCRNPVTTRNTATTDEPQWLQKAETQRQKELTAVLQKLLAILHFAVVRPKQRCVFGRISQNQRIQRRNDAELSGGIEGGGGNPIIGGTPKKGVVCMWTPC
jgi:hypothetical protein